ncbi:5823_t:CDS:1, partial [Ambispora gerdemannii]
MDKSLTPEYLDWHAKLVDSPSHLTDKICSSLYSAYIEETGLDPWIKSEAPESSQIKKGAVKLLIATEAEKKRWSMGCFRGDLEKDI